MSGHATAVPPASETNSRRVMRLSSRVPGHLSRWGKFAKGILMSASVQPGLPPWGPHVHFRRVQTLVREGSPLVKAAQFCLVAPPMRPETPVRANPAQRPLRTPWTSFRWMIIIGRIVLVFSAVTSNPIMHQQHRATKVPFWS